MTRWIIQITRLACIVALAVGLTACAASQPKETEELHPFAEFSAAEIIEAGDKAMNKGENDRAVFIYRQALEVEETADTWFRLGLAKLKLGDEGFAYNAFNNALKLDPEHVSSHVELGLMHVGTGQPKMATRHLNRAIELDPTRWRAHNMLGVIADVQRDYPAAIRHYKLALEYYPESAMLMNNVGYSYYLSGDLQEATNWLDAAIQAQPGYEKAIRNLALLYARQGWYQEAVETFLKVVEKPEAYNDVGYIAMRNGDYDDASRLLTDAIRLSPVYYVTAYNNLELLKEQIKKSGKREKSAALVENISEVVFADDQEARTLKVMPQALNVRAAPDSDSDIIDYLKTGDSVQIIMAKDAWTFISYRPEGVVRDLSGWVKSRYLRDPNARPTVSSGVPTGLANTNTAPQSAAPAEEKPVESVPIATAAESALDIFALEPPVAETVKADATIDEPAIQPEVQAEVQAIGVDDSTVIVTDPNTSGDLLADLDAPLTMDDETASNADSTTADAGQSQNARDGDTAMAID